jgi:hypothetical protein
MPDQLITLETTLCRLEEMLAADLDEETVMVDIDKGKYYGLNGCGTRIWALLSKPITVRNLCHKLTDEFAVSTTQCEQDLIDFLRALLARNMVKIVSPDAS